MATLRFSVLALALVLLAFAAAHDSSSMVTMEHRVDGVVKTDLFSAHGADVFVSPRHPDFAAHLHAAVRQLAVHVTPAPHLEAAGARVHTASGLLALLVSPPAADAFVRVAPNAAAGLRYEAGIEQKPQAALALALVVNATTGEVVSGAAAAVAALRAHEVSPLGTWHVMADPAHANDLNMGLTARGLKLSVHLRLTLLCHLHDAHALRAQHLRVQQQHSSSGAGAVQLQGVTVPPPIIDSYRTQIETRLGGWDVVNLLKVEQLNAFLSKHTYTQIPDGMVHPTFTPLRPTSNCHKLEPRKPQSPTNPYVCEYQTRTAATFKFTSVQLGMDYSDKSELRFVMTFNLSGADSFIKYDMYYRECNAQHQPVNPSAAPVFYYNDSILCDPDYGCNPSIQLKVKVGSVDGRVSGDASNNLQFGMQIKPGSVESFLPDDDQGTADTNLALEKVLRALLRVNGFDFPLGSLYPAANEIIPKSFLLQQFGTDTLAVCIAAQDSPSTQQEHTLLLDLNSNDQFFNSSAFPYTAALVVSSQYMMSLLNRHGATFTSALQSFPVSLLAEDESIPPPATTQHLRPRPFVLSNVAGQAIPTMVLTHSTRTVENHAGALCPDDKKEWDTLFYANVSLRLDYGGGGITAVMKQTNSQTFFMISKNDPAGVCHHIDSGTLTVAINAGAGQGFYPSPLSYDPVADTFSASLTANPTCVVSGADGEDITVTQVSGGLSQWLHVGEHHSYSDYFNIITSHLNLQITAVLDKVSVRLVKSILYAYGCTKYFEIDPNALYTPGDFYMFGTINVPAPNSPITSC